MGRRFSVPFTATASTAAVVLWEISPAANKPIRLCAVYLQCTTELGDVEEEQLRILINRKTGAAATGTGTAVTPQPIDYMGTAATAGTTAKVMMTTAGTGGTTTTVHAEAFNVRAGYERIFPPEDRYQFIEPATSPNEVGLEVKIDAAPADSVTYTGTLIFEEEN